MVKIWSNFVNLLFESMDPLSLHTHTLNPSCPTRSSLTDSASSAAFHEGSYALAHLYKGDSSSLLR